MESFLKKLEHFLELKLVFFKYNIDASEFEMLDE